MSQTTSKLSTDQLMLIESRIANEKKSVGVGYLLLIFLGYFGVHNFYLRRPVLGAIELALTVWIVLSWTVVVAGWMDPKRVSDADNTAMIAVAYGLLGILLLFDFLTIPRAVRKDMDKRRRQLESQLLSQARCRGPNG